VTRPAVLLAFAAAALAQIPAPQIHFGHPIGQDRTSLQWDRVVSYFHTLDKVSERVLVRELGKTVGGRPFIAAWISAPETIANLDRYQDIQKRLADPRRTTTAEAEKLIAEGKSIVMITCTIHSTEVASAHTAVEFAYKLIAEDTPKHRAILQNTIFILVPSLNPDGIDIVTNWYRKTLGTPHEGTTPPELYHHYLGHDNNRDWYIFSQPETRLAISQLHNVWHPQIVYDVHQQGPFASRMFVPPWMDPIEPNIDPIIAQQCNMIGAGMAADLTAAGKTGIAVNAMYDFWTPARHYQAYHGGMRILSESASARLSTPIVVKPEQILTSAQGYDPRERSWNHLEPWMGGEWRLRDIIDYQLIAWESCLFQAATRRADLLRNFYRIGQRAIARTTPYAFVIPAAQRDPGAAQKLLETLRFGLVEVERNASGDYVVRMQQPYSAWAKTLLERQQYPDLRLYPGGPPKRPYDVTAHTLPLLMGVEVRTVDVPIKGDLQPARDFAFMRRPLAAADTESWRAINRIWDKGGEVWRDPESGDFSTGANPGYRRLSRPRVGLFRSYQPSMDEGWTRWLFDQFGFKYTSADKRRINAGALWRDFDVIVFPDQGPAVIANGFRPGTMPDEYVGGITQEGEGALKQFTTEGGKLVFLNASTAYAVGHLGVKAKNVLSGVSNRDFYCPGSLLAVRATGKNPLLYGMPDQFTIWMEGSPAWEAGAESVLEYPDGNVLASGWLLGEKLIAGRSALLDVPMGKGRAILFGMRPQYRGQSYLTFKLLFNALVY
jgi:hypothetical protein